MPYVESLDEFRKRMACEAVHSSGRLLFRHGARSDGQVHTDPPDDPQVLLVLRHEFLVAKAAAKTREYNSVHANVAAQAEFHGRGCGPDPNDYYPSWKKHLEKLAKEIEQRQNAARALEPQLPRNARIEAREQRRSQERQRAAEAVAALTHLPVF